MRKVRIFLSYVHSDKADILSLYHRLEKAGTEPRSKVSDEYSPIANFLTGMKEGLRIDVKL